MITFSSLRGSPSRARVRAIAVGHPRDVLVHAAAADLQLRPDRPVLVVDVQVRADPGSAAEHGVQIQRRGAGVRRDQRVLRHPELGGLIERDVVVGELANERRARRHRRVVGIAPVRVRRRRVAVDRRIDDQSLGPRRQIILRVENPALLADLEQRSLNRVVHIGERPQMREDASKVDATGRRAGARRTSQRPRRRRRRRHGARRRQSDSSAHGAGH